MKHTASAARLLPITYTHMHIVLIKECEAVVQVPLYQAFLRYFMCNPD